LILFLETTDFNNYQSLNTILLKDELNNIFWRN